MYITREILIVAVVVVVIVVVVIVVVVVAIILILLITIIRIIMLITVVPLASSINAPYNDLTLILITFHYSRLYYVLSPNVARLKERHSRLTFNKSSSKMLTQLLRLNYNLI